MLFRHTIFTLIQANLRQLSFIQRIHGQPASLRCYAIHPRFVPRAYNYSQFITGDNKIRHASDIHGTRLKCFISHNSSKKKRVVLRDETLKKQPFHI